MKYLRLAVSAFCLFVSIAAFAAIAHVQGAASTDNTNTATTLTIDPGHGRGDFQPIGAQRLDRVRCGPCSGHALNSPCHSARPGRARFTDNTNSTTASTIASGPSASPIIIGDSIIARIVYQATTQTIQSCTDLDGDDLD